MSNALIDWTFNLQRTEEEQTVRGIKRKVVTSLEVETALPLVLTQNAAKAGNENHLFVPESASLTIFGDEVTISGPLKTPGRKIVIFARALRAEADGANDPVICVDGAAWSENEAKPKAKGKLAKGQNGSDGYNQRVQPIPLPNEREVPGQPGWSAADHPDKMNGEGGEHGLQGQAAGHVWILCQKTDFGGSDGKLGISAVGGLGGEGQPGQEGADGGDGGKGSDFKREFIGYRLPTNGGDGGIGGAGGTGGQGGQGGDGGNIVVHSLTALPALTVAFQGGNGGAPGARGKGGSGGGQGLGGAGGFYAPPGSALGREIAAASDGRRGRDGDNGLEGPKAPESQAGSASLTNHEVPNTAVAELASVSQLQMLFERARADYLVTEKPSYTLRLMTIATKEELPDLGNNAVVVAFIGGAFHIRIFDADGEMAVDKPQSELGANVATEIGSLRGVLQAGRWSTDEELNKATEDNKRNHLIWVLCQLTNQTAGWFQARDNPEVIGLGAVTAFLLRQGMKDKQWLKAHSPDEHRNALIDALIAPPVFASQLRAMANQELVRFAWTKFGNPFALPDSPTLAALKQRLGLSLRSVILAGNWATDAEMQGKPEDDLLSDMISILADFTNQPDNWFEARDNYELVGMLAVVAVLLRQNIQDKQWLKAHSPDEHRDALIAALVKQTGTTAARLAPLDNQALVRLALVSPIALSSGLAGLRDSLQSAPEKAFSVYKRAAIITDAMSLAGYADFWTSIGERLDWVMRLLPNLPSKHPQKALAEKVLASAWMVSSHHQNGLDYFGKTPRFVPVVSFDTYRSAFENSLANLKDIEGAKEKYFTALKEQRDATNDLRTAVDKVKSHTTFLNARKAEIGRKLKDVGNKIDNLNDELKTGKSAVDTKLRGLTVEVKEAFGLSVETFFNCLSQLSFVNPHEPASAGAMAVSQLGAMLSEGMQSVLDNSGVPVKKSFLLDQIEVISQELPLRAELARRADANGYLSKGDSYRLLVGLDKFGELLKEFYQKLPEARAVRQTLDEYIEQITERNNHIDLYNALVGELLDIAGEVQKLELQKDAVQGKLGEKAQPGLPALATFVSGLYERAKAECIKDLYYAYRAFAFWALKPSGGFYDLLGSTPGAITAVQLEAALPEIREELLATLESAQSPPIFFPAKDDNEMSLGRVVVLTKEMHPDFFDDLIETGQAEFELAPAMRHSPPPDGPFEPSLTAWCEATRPPFNLNYPLPNPFHGMADVRLTKVRTWMIGMKTGDGNHAVTLVHLGQEQFRRTNDLPYPARTEPADAQDERKRDPEYVFHEIRQIPFIYQAAQLGYDSATNKFIPGQLSGGVGAVDGDLGFPAGRGDFGLPLKSQYAPIGPFAMWRLEVDEDNLRLDLYGLSMIVIDFHGFYRKFDR